MPQTQNRHREFSERLKALSESMIDLGTEMDYYGGFDGEMAKHGKELVNAGMMVKEWAMVVESD